MSQPPAAPASARAAAAAAAATPCQSRTPCQKPLSRARRPDAGEPGAVPVGGWALRVQGAGQAAGAPAQGAPRRGAPLGPPPHRHRRLHRASFNLPCTLSVAAREYVDGTPVADLVVDDLTPIALGFDDAAERKAQCMSALLCRH
jgi:hypothetical protein